MLSEPPVSAWKKQFYDELEQKLTGICRLILSTSAPTARRGRRKAKRPIDTHALIQDAFDGLKQWCSEEIERRVQALGASMTPASERVDAEDVTTQRVHAVINQCDSGSHQADSGDGTKTAGLPTSLLSRQDEIISLDDPTRGERAKVPQTSGSPSTTSRPPQSDVDHPPLAQQRAPTDTHQTPTARGDAPTSQPSPGMGADQPDAQTPATTPSSPPPSLGTIGGQRDAHHRETRKTTRAALTVPSMGPPAIVQNQSARSIADEFRLDSNCLGDDLIPNLHRLMSKPKVTLPLLDFNWKQVAQAICPPPDHDLLAVKYESRNGVSRLFLADAAKFCPPALDTVVEKPSDPENCFERLIRHPPHGNIPYYVGPLPNSELDRLFPSGTLSQLLGDIRGSTTLYAHWGERGSGTGYHCEDGEERSYNVNLLGYKFWVLIDPRDTAKFEELCERLVPGGKGCGLRCDQFVRHKCLVITLAKLRAEGIRFRTVCAGPGDMVVTQPRQYHLVVNLTASFALATNFIFPGEVPIRPGTPVCPDCGLYNLDHPNIVQISGTATGPDKDSMVSRPASRNTASLKNGKRRAPPLLTDSKRKKTMEPRTDVTALAAACRDRAAFLRLCSLIRAWRDRTLPLMEVDHSKNYAPQLVHIVDHAEAKTTLSRFVCRFANERLAEVTKVADYERTPTDIITKLLEELCRENTMQRRSQLLRQLETGREWNQLCKGCDGLISLIPLVTPGSHSDLSASNYRGLAKSDGTVKQFQDSVSATSFGRSLLYMGKIIQEALWLQKEVPLFRWEDWDMQQLERMSGGKLEPLMEVFPVLTANSYDPNTANWPKPDFWPWDWPADPTMVPADDVEQCQLCKVSGCNCISSILPDRIPHITGVDGRGQGVRAIGFEGEIVYKKEQVLGELLGELAPLDTHHDGWAMELVRPDFNDEPIAQIYTKNTSNWVRKVNHSCRPSAAFRVMKISGSWRQMLVAITDIPHNGEVTAGCGNEFLRGKGIKCQCGYCG